MSDIDRESYLEDEDRLPWLEAVESDEYEEGLSTSKLLGLVLAALALLGILGFGFYWMKNKDGAPEGDGTLIAAPNGDYKQQPDAPGGMKVEGQGDTSFAASEGAEAQGKVAAAGTPEAPVAGIKVNPQAAQPPVAGGKQAVTTAVPPSQGAPAPVAAPAAGGALVQLGAYGSQATADAGWAKAVKSNPSLASLQKVVQAAQVGGQTVYRLRANAGTVANAASVCAKVSPCMVVK